MVVITGPRQVGKTYLAKQVMAEFKRPQYLNFDAPEDRSIILSRSWPLDVDLLVFDEIHKMKGWKTFLKGVYDTRPSDQRILVTGSARLETFRQSGESLAGRYFHLRLHPLSVKELAHEIPASEAVDRINRLGGFPEPYLSGSEEDAARWRHQYYTDIVREDILDFSRIHEVRAMKTLLEMLRRRVGSPISYSVLAEDLQVAPNTVKKYLFILEGLYIIFLVRPFHRLVQRSILKEPKAYFFDSGFVLGDEGVRLENTCAQALLKHAHYLHDAKGKDIDLHYLRTKEGREIDFVLTENGTPTLLLESKLSDDALSRPLIYHKERFVEVEAVQLVHRLRKETRRQGIDVVRAGDWLARLEA